VQATGNRALFLDGPVARAFLQALPPAQKDRAALLSDEKIDTADYHAVLFEGDSDALRLLSRRVAARAGSIVSVQGISVDSTAQGQGYVLDRLVTERSISVNTAAAGGNANLMTIG
jgi:RHH-type proline utilization regulon transcriptional repressor/proline dehydrogenase/delta 1-pyrroline-5-carboxylate dehydrogenase